MEDSVSMPFFFGAEFYKLLSAFIRPLKSQRLKNSEKKTGMSENHTGKPTKTVSYDERSGTGVDVSGTIFFLRSLRTRKIDCK